MNAGSPLGFNVYLSVARIHDKIKQIEPALHIMENVDKWGFWFVCGVLCIFGRFYVCVFFCHTDFYEHNLL